MVGRFIYFNSHILTLQFYYISNVVISLLSFVNLTIAFLNTAGGQVLIGFGKKGKLLGLLDDDIRTMHHYQNRIEDALRKALGKAALPFIDVSMIRWGSEDVCYIACGKASYEVTCTHQKYNDMAGHEKRQKLIYRRVNAQSVYDAVGLLQE